MSSPSKFCPHCNRFYSGGLKACPSCSNGRIAVPEENPFLSGQYQSQPTRIELARGTELLDRFIVQKKLGEGLWSSVYLAQDSRRSKEVALKVVTLSQTSELELVQHHQRELNLFAQLCDFNHVLQVHDLHSVPWEGVHLLLLSMEYADGGSLRSWLSHHQADRETRMTKGLEFFLQACLGIMAIHEANVLHLDIKPENMLFVHGRLKVSDLGASHSPLLSPDGWDGQGHPVSLEMGTPVYMSPEHFIAAHPDDLDQRSDIYSLGVILYEIVSPHGRPPFGGSMDRVRDCHLNMPPRLLENIEGDLQQIVMRCLEKDPDERFRSVSELMEALDRLHRNQSKPKAPPEAEPQNRIEAKWEQASLCYAEDDLSSASSLLVEILSEDPSHFGARRMQVDIQTRYDQVEQLCRDMEGRLENGELEECVSLLSALAEVYPGHPSAAIAQTKTLLKAKRFAWLMEIGRQALSTRRWGAALRSFEEARRINRDGPNIGEILELLNRIQDNRREMDLAVNMADFERAGQLAGLVDSLAAELASQLSPIKEDADG